ncbi:MAG: CoA-acylating methylmalonate-semialdehyde dehydrogenase, partial [Planctomycetes bacterium]|nr:CoA-acylating methylmalonate-semialdehyde dehydrogenase [Planctomycetota bacterium]
MPGLVSSTFDRVANYIGGRLASSDSPPTAEVCNPATGDVLAVTPGGGPAEVAQAVAAAKAAFPEWSQTPVTQRAKILFRCRQVLTDRAEELARLITLENGKTLDEARGDVTRGLEVLDFACHIPHLLKGESLSDVAEKLDGVTSREPLGVCVGITPFNFPVMVPMWMVPLAIACGNTFVLKPSPKVPLSANRLAELFTEGGLPAGVFNVVHGGREAVAALCEHRDVRAVSFVGATPTARWVYETAARHGKRVQSAGGAKNVLLVMPDADWDSTIRAVIGSAFGCAGQRCMAGSLLMGVGEAARPLREKVQAAAEALTLGNSLENPAVNMGPVIDRAARDRLFGTINRAANEGLPLICDGRERVPECGFFVGPTVFDSVTPDRALFQEELFGPVVALVEPATLSEAIDWLNQLPFGNGATIFTGS